MNSFFIYNNYIQISRRFIFLISNLQEEKKRIINIGISGGSTYTNIFKTIYLSRLPFNFAHTSLFLTDERHVPIQNEESNFGNLNTAFKNNITNKFARVHHIPYIENPEEVCVKYSNILKNNLPVKDGFPIFDLIFLGIGTDGHTASLFPEKHSLVFNNGLCGVSIHPKTGQIRTTLTYEVIIRAENIVFIATGYEKKDIVARALNNELENDSSPVQQILNKHKSVSWIIDKKAGDKIW